MGGGEGGGRPALLRVSTVRGEPYNVEGRKLIPVVRIVSFGKASATIGTRRLGGRGGGFVWVRPLAVVEETPEGERRIAVTDGTAGAVRRLLGAAAAIAVVLAAVRWLAHRAR
jgi:uncharacterized spore protein YtfJ